jgi:hypothetical protein
VITILANIVLLFLILSAALVAGYWSRGSSRPLGMRVARYCAWWLFQVAKVRARLGRS